VFLAAFAIDSIPLLSASARAAQHEALSLCAPSIAKSLRSIKGRNPQSINQPSFSVWVAVPVKPTVDAVSAEITSPALSRPESFLTVSLFPVVVSPTIVIMDQPRCSSPLNLTCIGEK